MSDRYRLLDHLGNVLRRQGRVFKRRRLRFVLGNDRPIGRATRSQERRVGITPEQLRHLLDWCGELGLQLEALVVEGAGQRAGYSDDEYVRVGGEIVSIEELQFEEPVDLVHALKEPASYEATIPRPFFRIGALHTGDFHDDTGLAELLLAAGPMSGAPSRYVTIFDGSNVGAPGAFRVPIRGSMSVFAGRIAGEWAEAHLVDNDLNGRVVILGGGNAGRAAAQRCLMSGHVTRLHLFDDLSRPDRLAALALELADEPRVEVRGTEGLDHPNLVESLTGSVACLIAVAKPGEAAPRAIRLETLLHVSHPRSITVDISIDERGAISDPEIHPSMTSDEIIALLQRRFQASGNRRYRAVANMPRSNPHDASAAHGEAVLPYLATLLVLSAEHNGVIAATEWLASRPRVPASMDPQSAADDDLFDALAQDLRNGMALYSRGQRWVVEEFVADPDAVHGFLVRKGIPFQFCVGSLEPVVGDLPGRELHRLRARYGAFPSEVRQALDAAVGPCHPFRVVSHPQVDGTCSEDAARALAVPLDRVLKTLVFAAGDGRQVVAVCTGGQRISHSKLAEVSTCSALHLATRVDDISGGYPAGAIPLFRLLESARAQGHGIYVDPAVLHERSVYCAAGSVHVGMEFDPRILGECADVAIADISEPRPFTQEAKDRLLKELQRLADAIRHEHMDEADEHLRRIITSLTEATPQMMEALGS